MSAIEYMRPTNNKKKKSSRVLIPPPEEDDEPSVEVVNHKLEYETRCLEATKRVKENVIK